MSTINQYNSQASLQAALEPAHARVDGRTEKDWLCFLSNFASLVNFYNNENRLNGNWAPFLLKDPVFLLASISQTDFNGLHTLYLNTCSKLKQLLLQNADNEDIPDSFNQLFDQITAIFMRIGQWIYYMQGSGDEYSLKAFTASQTQNTFSRYLWAILSLRQNLYLSQAIPGIRPVNSSGVQWFRYGDEAIWKQNKDKNPYWEILGLQHPVKENSAGDIFDSLTKAGDEVFQFFHTVICYAGTEFDNLESRKSRYPDTTLLRTFIHLLQVQQHQLNGITGRHLQFYYQDVLKQRQQPALPDSVFLCATLARNNEPFCLPAGTLFYAGLDAETQPVLFATTKKVNLNPATITGTYTLCSPPVLPGREEALYLNSIPAPGLPGKDESGRIKTWKTFGGTPDEGAVRVKQGLAFASPLLLLREGQRTITLTLGFSGFLSTKLLEQAGYYLSTQAGWLKVNASLLPQQNAPAKTRQAQVVIDLGAAGPAIEAFSKQTDGITSCWPMLKMEFTSFENLAAPPEISSLTIEVRVSKTKAVQLYNDSGSLDHKTPFPPFGTAPAVNSGFIIGSNEIFSKPLTSLGITVYWDRLPFDFAMYYQRYNQYVQQYSRYAVQPIPSLAGKVTASKWNWKNLAGMFRRNNDSTQVYQPYPFNNYCFQVGFTVLQNQSWTAFNMKGPYNTASSLPQTGPSGQDIPPRLPVEAYEPLFAVDTIGGLVPASSFTYTPDGRSGFVCNPGIQLSPLKFTDDSASGFLKISLSAPGYGFGAGLYPSVVAETAYENALSLINRERPAEVTANFYIDDTIDLPPAQTDRENASSGPKNKKTVKALIVQAPFTPKALGFEASYSASVDCFSDPYPFQCFRYAPFCNYAVYDNLGTANNCCYSDGPSPVHAAPVVPEFPLYLSCPYSGYLFLELENIIPSQTANFYFEQAGSFTTAAAAKIDYYYLSTGGWKPLPLLSDSTNGLRCSGIIEVNIPADITKENPVMPENKYWIFLGRKDGPATAIAETVLVTTNGFTTQRTGNGSLRAGTTPWLAAGTIVRPQFAIPQLAAVAQPFPSFGGRAAETGADMNLRVSNRLATKDRAVSGTDYSRLICQKFPELYFSKTVFNRPANRTGVYAIRSFKHWTEPLAFTPLLSACQQQQMQTFLLERAPAFAHVEVLNFDLQYVQVIATVSLCPGFEIRDVQDRLDHSLNLFFSPWISTGLQQAAIGQVITEAQLIDFMKKTAGVSEIDSITCKTWMAGSPQYETTIVPLTGTALLVSCMNHNIQCIPAL